MASAVGAKFAIVAVAQQRVVVRIRFEVDVAAIAAVAARWAAARNVLLPAERHAAVAAVAAFHRDFGFVSKHEAPALRGCPTNRAYADGGEENSEEGDSDARAVRHSECGDFSSQPALQTSSQRDDAASSAVQDADEAAAAALVFEAHDAVDQREKRIVLGAADVLARLVARAALANQDAAAGDQPGRQSA